MKFSNLIFMILIAFAALSLSFGSNSPPSADIQADCIVTEANQAIFEQLSENVVVEISTAGLMIEMHSIFNYEIKNEMEYSPAQNVPKNRWIEEGAPHPMKAFNKYTDGFCYRKARDGLVYS